MGRSNCLFSVWLRLVLASSNFGCISFVSIKRYLILIHAECVHLHSARAQSIQLDTEGLLQRYIERTQVDEIYNEAGARLITFGITGSVYFGPAITVAGMRPTYSCEASLLRSSVHYGQAGTIDELEAAHTSELSIRSCLICLSRYTQVLQIQDWQLVFRDIVFYLINLHYPRRIPQGIMRATCGFYQCPHQATYSSDRRAVLPIVQPPRN